MSRTMVNVWDDAVRKAQRLTGMKKKVEVVNLALEELVRQREIYKGIMELEGRVRWEGDLKVLRKDRKFDFGG